MLLRHFGYPESAKKRDVTQLYEYSWGSFCIICLTYIGS